MAGIGNYHDKRSAFFKSYFAKALKYQDYLATGERVHQQRWNRFPRASPGYFPSQLQMQLT